MTTPRGLDHLVLPVRDLDAAGRHYEAMGFKVGARNRHPWGTENRLVQFPGTFLELISVGEGVHIVPPQGGDFGFAWFIAEHLRRYGDGFALLVLESTDAEADRRDFEARDIGGYDLFAFERQGRRADGSVVRVAFSLAFAAEPSMPDLGCFVCQQHEPQNFWSPALQEHPNGATGIGGTVTLAENPAAVAPFLAAFSGVAPACTGPRNAAFVTPRGTLEAMSPACFADVLGTAPDVDLARGPRHAAFKVFAPIEPMAERLASAGIPFTRHRKHIALAARDNHGTVLVFEEPRR